MRTAKEIEQLFGDLDEHIADDLEDQDLDFKQWPDRSRNDATDLIVKMAICMANGGGGTVVFGVADHESGRSKVILGIPLEIDVNILKKAVYDKTDPKITPVFEEILVTEGTGRVLIMQVYPGLPPYTDTSGRGTVRIGKDCQPLTGTMRRKIAVETGESDYTAEQIPGDPSSLISPSAMEQLRLVAKAEQAPDDLLNQSDVELLHSLNLIQNGRLTRAGLLLGGSEEAVHRLMPGYVWSFFRMERDTEYSLREDHSTSIAVSVLRLDELIRMYNPITTIQKGMYHFEYRKYPDIAIGEALMNAFCHRDYQSSSPTIVKSYLDHLEITNPGGLIGGITPSNILHHAPIPRNPLLVQALISLRLVNRSNLGVSRMFRAFLIEGKGAPDIDDIGDSVRVIFSEQEISPAFRTFIQEQAGNDRIFHVDELLLFRYLLTHPEIDIGTAIRICQQKEGQIKIVLHQLEREGFVERGGTGRGTYWCMHPNLYQKISESEEQELNRRINREAAKTRILSILIERGQRGEPGLSNADIRRITHYDRNQVYLLMKELKREEPRIIGPGKGHTAVYAYSYDQKS